MSNKLPTNSPAFAKARQSLQQLPQKLKKCNQQLLAYGTCVKEWDNIRRGECSKEFLALKNCVQKS